MTSAFISNMFVRYYAKEIGIKLIRGCMRKYTFKEKTDGNHGKWYRETDQGLVDFAVNNTQALEALKKIAREKVEIK